MIKLLSQKKYKIFSKIIFYFVFAYTRVPPRELKPVPSAPIRVSRITLRSPIFDVTICTNKNFLNEFDTCT